MKVRRTPLRSCQARRCLRRSSSTRVMSISKTVETWAEVRFDRIMCSAVFLRIGDIGTTSTRPVGAGPGIAGGGAAGGAGAQPEQPAWRAPGPASPGSRCGRGCPAWSPGRRSRCRARRRCPRDARRRSAGPPVRSGPAGARPRSSPSLREPAAPEPSQRAGAVGGLAARPPAGSSPAGPESARPAAPGPRPEGPRRRAELARTVARASAAAVASAPSSAIRPTTVLTGTVAPGGTRISRRTPAAGDGISASTLSVEISKRGSSRSTGVADALQPLGDRAFGDRFAHLRHDDVGHALPHQETATHASMACP